MDLIHMFLNLVAPPFTFFSLMLFLPPFQAFKWFLSFLATIFSEDVSGKVVLITGASSVIGEVNWFFYAKSPNLSKTKKNKNKSFFKSSLRPCLVLKVSINKKYFFKNTKIERSRKKKLLMDYSLAIFYVS